MLQLVDEDGKPKADVDPRVLTQARLIFNDQQQPTDDDEFNDTMAALVKEYADAMPSGSPDNEDPADAADEIRR